MRFLGLIALFLPTLAFGQDIETPSGLLRITDTEVDGIPAQELWVGSQRVEFDSHAQFLWVEDQTGSLFLIGIAMGGNACPAQYAWVQTEAGHLKATPSFGNCSDLAEVSHDGKTATVILPNMDGSGLRTAYVYDGIGVVEQPLGRVASDLPPGSDPDLWVGRYPFEILQAADWQPFLVGLMGQGALDDARITVSLASPMQIDGDWVVGQGCLKATCDDTFGAIALHRTDGRVIVLIKDYDQPLRVWGDTTGAPKSIAARLAR